MVGLESAHVASLAEWVHLLRLERDDATRNHLTVERAGSVEQLLHLAGHRRRYHVRPLAHAQERAARSVDRDGAHVIEMAVTEQYQRLIDGGSGAHPQVEQQPQARDLDTGLETRHADARKLDPRHGAPTA
jgi:ribulose-5-phosphate 4-epimerase/fuculose-1-phosphate aldolase